MTDQQIAMDRQIKIVQMLPFLLLPFAAFLHLAKSEDTTEVYMLAFMNISTDKPGLLSYEQLILNALKPNTQIRAMTFDAMVDEKTVLPELIDGTGSIGIDFRTTADLVSGASETVTNHGLFVVASDKISLQAIKSVQQSTDGYQSIPLTHSSNDFYVVSYDEVPGIGHSTYAVAALEDYTCVEITRVNGSAEHRVALVSLDAYQVYNGLSQMEDFTGLRITSSRPVAVYAGHECSEIPVGKLFCDHMQAQMPPVLEWGTLHHVPPILGRNKKAGYTLRVLASQDNTDILIRYPTSGRNESLLANRGSQFVEWSVDDAHLAVTVECSAPCLVMQYNRGYRMLGYSVTDTKTDPFMTLIPSTRNYEFSLHFGTATYIALNRTFEFTNFLSIVVPTSNIDEIKYDLNSISSAWTDLKNGYSMNTFDIKPGQHNVQSESGDVPMMGYVYGHGGEHITGYGYPAGFNVTGDKVRSTRLQAEAGIGQGTANQTDSTSVVGICETPFDPSVVQSHDSLQVIYLTFELKTKRYEPCASRALSAMEAVLEDIRNETNWLICLNLLCIPAESTWVYSINIVQPESTNPLKEITFQVTLWSSQTEVIKNAVACRNHLTNYFSDYGDYTQRWRTPLPIPNKCDPTDLEFLTPPQIVLPKNWRCAQ